MPAQTFTTLHKFGFADGRAPEAGLVQATDGDFYGTTYFGGYARTCPENCGTVFKISKAGKLTRVLSFDFTDGEYPRGGLVQATNGNFYSTTRGAGGGDGADGHGTFFQITPSGTLTTLYVFCSENGCADGDYPSAGPIRASSGGFVGTTGGGGATGNGTVFTITPSGTLTTLHSFDRVDGSSPSGLVEATDGNFYGTTYYGGANLAGTMFKITPTGTLTSLYSFCSQTNCSDGETPAAGLVQGNDGNFYGTTTAGGADGGGTVFQITPLGKLTTLYSFCSKDNCTDGEGPYAALIQASDGNFYGTTPLGGASGAGTLFEITPAGTLTTLHSFDGTDGELPYAGLVQGTDGNFYGTTQGAGIGSPDVDGTVFRLSVGLGPFVETQTSAGKVGAAIKILGNDLKGSTSVTFNGTAATFTVASSTEISTSVPAGATTGKVQVATSNGTLTSSRNFQVLP